MKKQIIYLLALCVMAITITGCGQDAEEQAKAQDTVMDASGASGQPQEAGSLESGGEEASDSGEPDREAEQENQTGEGQEQGTQQEPAAPAATQEETNPEPEMVTITNPSWDYYISQPAEPGTAPLTLTLLEQSANQITDTEEWFERNGLVLPEYSDDRYSFLVEDGMMIHILENDMMKATLDFSQFQYADDFKPEDMDFVDQNIEGAAICDGILYVSTFHYTYAETSPHNGYITAIDLADYSVLWKTQALVCNSRNFEMVGDVILCGYGFTAEDDFLYQIDRKTGAVIGKTDLASMMDYIVYQDGRLYVRTYHTDYVFQVG